MENKINIAELLKDCPSGMELDCTMYDNLYFNQVYDDSDCLYKIGCYTIVDEIRTTVNFTEFGTFNTHANSKCVIFPKGKTTWEGFVPPCKFKDGDIVVTQTSYNFIFYSIYQGAEDREVLTYVDYYLGSNKLMFNTTFHSLCFTDEIVEQRLATEEEKSKLFQAIKDNGYKWNSETKTLEKLVEPKFKVGDRIKVICNNNQYDIKELTDTHYTLVEVINKFKYTEPISEDKNWELVPSKFDINTLVPLESKVLVRNVGAWLPAFWGYYSKEYTYPFVVDGGNTFAQCIPYEGNEHLLGTTNDCDNFYKNWE